VCEGVFGGGGGVDDDGAAAGAVMVGLDLPTIFADMVSESDVCTCA
jgi:hypothetical protein